MAELEKAFRRVDAELRLIVALKSTDWEIKYIANDLEDTYEKRDFEASYRNLMANQVSSDNLRRVVEAGDLTGQVYIFDRVIVFHFPSSRYEGVFASYDRGDDVPIAEVIETAENVPVIK